MRALTSDPVDAAAFPFRLVLRHLSEMLFAQIDRERRLMPFPHVARMARSVVLIGSLAHLPLRRADGDGWIGIDAAADRGRPVSATAIATSMNLPLTTVRRQLATLVEADLLRREKTGFLVGPAHVDGPIVRAMAAADVAGFLAILRALAEQGYGRAAALLAAGADRVPAMVVARLLATLALRTMENSVDRHRDLVFAYIHGAIIVANVRHITGDPALASRFAAEDRPPPDEMRRPISARSLAESLDLPFETVRRRIANLLARGEVDLRPTGVIVPARVLTTDRHMRMVRYEVSMFEQMLQTLDTLARSANVAAVGEAAPPVPRPTQNGGQRD